MREIASTHLAPYDALEKELLDGVAQLRQLEHILAVERGGDAAERVGAHGVEIVEHQHPCRKEGGVKGRRRCAGDMHGRSACGGWSGGARTVDERPSVGEVLRAALQHVVDCEGLADGAIVEVRMQRTLRRAGCEGEEGMTAGHCSASGTRYAPSPP